LVGGSYVLPINAAIEAPTHIGVSRLGTQQTAPTMWGQPIFALTHNTQLAVWRENGFRTRDAVLAIRKELAKVLALRRSRPKLPSAVTGAVLFGSGQPAHLPARREQHEPGKPFSTLGEIE
jgi:hypothetical protein